MKKTKLILISFILFLMSACGSSLKKYTTTATDLGFDTVVTFLGYCENEESYQQYNEFLQSEFKRYDKLFDKYNNYEDLHNIKTINDSAGKKAVKVDPEIIELLQLSKVYDEISNHSFDSTMGSVLNIWHDAREQALLAISNNQEPHIPSLDQLQQAKQHTGWNHIQIDEQNHTVYIDDSQISLDVGGNAKGFAVEKIAQKLEKKGLKHAIINGGGNIRLIGNKPDSDGWRVGVQIPNLQQQDTDSLLSIEISESMSIVTSGDYQRYFMADGMIMHHIIDPTTLFPARHARSVTIITKDSTIADTLSTALYSLSHQDGEKLLNKLAKEKGIQADAIWVYDKQQPREDESPYIKRGNYEIVTTNGIKDSIVK